MSVVRHPFSGISRTDSNDSAAQTNLVRLSDADRVRDEPDRIAFHRGPRDTSSMFVFETNLRGALGNAKNTSEVSSMCRRAKMPGRVSTSIRRWAN